MKLKLRHLSPFYKGAVLQVGAKTADHIAFNVWYTAAGRTDAPRTALPFWYGVGPLNIAYDDYVLNLGLPAALALIGKYKKSAKYREMAKGAALTGVPLFLNLLLQSPQLLPLSRPVTMQMRTAPMRLNVRPAMTNGIAAAGLKYPQTGVQGKYGK